MIGESEPTFKRWTERAKGIALMGVIAAAIASGYAFAISPTVETGREFTGAITSFNQGITGSFSAVTVPAGQQYTLTDLIVSNPGPLSSNITIGVGNTDCVDYVARTHLILVPGEGTVHVPLLTGISAAAGKRICVDVTPQQMRWTLRGYLSNAT